MTMKLMLLIALLLVLSSPVWAWEHDYSTPYESGITSDYLMREDARDQREYERQLYYEQQIQQEQERRERENRSGYCPGNPGCSLIY